MVQHSGSIEPEENTITIDEQSQHILTIIGNKLAAQREDKRSSVESISKDLRIRASLLRAIEEGNITEFPGDSYYYGFARNYATALGSDISEEISKYRKLKEQQERAGFQAVESKIINVDAPVSSNRSDRSKIAAATIASSAAAFSTVGDGSDRQALYNNSKAALQHLLTETPVKTRTAVMFVAMGFVIVLLYALWIMFSGLGEDKGGSAGIYEDSEDQAYESSAAEIVLESESEQLTESSASSSSVFRLTQDVIQDAESVDSKALKSNNNQTGNEYGNPVNARVWVQATSGSWVSVVDVSKVDVEAGETGEIFARELKPNDIYYVPQGDQIFIKAGNASGVRLIVDNKKMDLLGRNGQVRYSSLDAESVLAGTNFARGTRLAQLLQAITRAQNR